MLLYVDLICFQVYELSAASSSSEILNESSMMNASMAEDIDDCMVLLEAAEKKVHIVNRAEGGCLCISATFNPSV